MPSSSATPQYTWDDFVALAEDDRRELIDISERRGVMPDVQFYAQGNDAALTQDNGLVSGCPDMVEGLEILLAKLWS